MSHFVIDGRASLSGTIPVYGSKNAALPLMAAALLTSEEIILENIPAISDAEKMISILQSIGAEAVREGTTIRITAGALSADRITVKEVGSLRGSILLLGALLGRMGRAEVPKPGGDIIGARPIDVHLDGFRQLGARVAEEDGLVRIDGTHMKAGTVVLREFSVTATENIMLAAAALAGTTTIEIAAAEPHVAALAGLLRIMGAKVDGAGTHTIRVTGSRNLSGARFVNIPDMLEAGLFILLAAATQSEVEVQGVPMDDLLLFFKKLDDIGIQYETSKLSKVSELSKLSTTDVTVRPSDMRSFRVQTLPHPGIATDLQAPFSVIATQVTGSSLIHDPMYEGRFKHIAELQKMGANVIAADPHRVVITGPTILRGRRIPSLDIRAGATLLMAGLVAEGQTIIDEAEIIKRGYAELPERLRAIGAKIEEVQS